MPSGNSSPICLECEGTGRDYTAICGDCHGSGQFTPPVISATAVLTTPPTPSAPIMEEGETEVK